MASEGERPDEGEDEVPEAEPEAEVEIEIEAEIDDGEELSQERFLQSLRRSIQEIVESAVREAVELGRRGRGWKSALDEEMDRVRLEVRRAFQTAKAGVRPLDVERIKEQLRGRSNTLMTRVGDEELERIDLLVEAGLFESRSEAAAFLIRAGLEARGDLVGKVEDTAQRISELKGRLRRELVGEEE